MKKSIITLGILAASAFGALTSCEDMMTVDTGDKAYVNANDTLYSYLGIMRAMQDIAERQVILGEIRGDLVSSTEYTTDTLYAISHFEDPQDESCSMLQISDYYNIINNCNFYIHNCDTSAIKSNIKYMIPEYAQVKAIRAWTYLQLVKNYKEVPYITEPIKNLDVIKNFDYNNSLVNKDNLVDKLIEDGILDLMDTRYPGYGTKNDYATWENGDVQISARLCYIPIRLVIGDLYLLRGNSTADYEQAARYYYDFLKKEKDPMPLSYEDINNYRNGIASYVNANNYGRWAGTYDYNSSTEVISLIPSAANAGLGKMLTRVADIFGYKPTSSQSASAVVNDDGDATGEFSVGGSINVSRNYKRQYGPSEAYNDVNYAQTTIYHAKQNNVMVEAATYIPNADSRRYVSVEEFNYEGNSYPLCSKAAKSATFYYTIPTYRKTLVWLRLAEAINRAGYPEYAFAILKDGLNEQNIPTIGDRYEPIFDENGYQLISNGDVDVWRDASGETPVYYQKDEENNLVVYEGTVGSKFKPVTTTIENDSVYHKSTKQAMYYITDLALVNKFNNFLDFTDLVWESTYGVHARGAGFGSYTSTTGGVETNITGYNDSVVYDYSKIVKAQGVDIKTASREDIIDAVENIIVDELALETAFEGNRFTDLVRIADHKNAAGGKGTEWLAKKIANRGTHRATEKLPAVTAEDAEIYTKLLDTKNWYFSVPKWEVK